MGEKKEWESKDTIAAWCLKCKEKIPYKLNDVNSVKRHIQKKHPNLFKEEGSKKRQKTSALHDCFASVPKRDLKPSTTADQKMGEALLVQWTATSLRPFTIIEDKGFLQFVHWLNVLRTNFIVPSRNKHQDQLMKVADMVMKQLKTKIEKEMDYFTMTTDIWSSRVMESYMAETLHYLTQDFEIQNLTIEVTPFRGSHTALNIRNFWEDSFCAFGLSTEKLTMMMRDNASNGVKACND